MMLPDTGVSVGLTNKSVINLLCTFKTSTSRKLTEVLEKSKVNLMVGGGGGGGGGERGD